MDRNHDRRRRRISLGAEFDADAKAYFEAANIIDGTEKSAANALVVGLKNNSIFTKMVGLYFMSPTSLAAATVNVKTPGTFDITWVNTPTHSINGVDFNGTTQYGQTGIIPNVDLTDNDVCLSYYSRDDVDANTSEIGCNNSNTQRLILFLKTANNIQHDVYNITTGRVSGVITDSLGLIVGSRTSTSSNSVYQDGSQKGTNATSGGTIPTIELYIGARNNNSVADFFSTKQCAFASIGTSLSAAQVSILDGLVLTYQQNVISGGRDV